MFGAVQGADNGNEKHKVRETTANRSDEEEQLGTLDCAGTANAGLGMQQGITWCNLRSEEKIARQ